MDNPTSPDTPSTGSNQVVSDNKQTAENVVPNAPVIQPPYTYPTSTFPLAQGSQFLGQSQLQPQQQQPPAPPPQPQTLSSEQIQQTQQAAPTPSNTIKSNVQTVPANQQPVNAILDTLVSQINSAPPPPPAIQPLLPPDTSTGNVASPPSVANIVPNPSQNQEQQSQSMTPSSPQKTVVTKVKLTDELNIFDWFRATDIINQIAEKAKSSVDSVITALDPGMKEYLYSGGNINIIVISDSDSLVSPIRDAFQSVFGRATVVAARYNPPAAAAEYPVKLARGFDEAITVAQERIKKLRLDTSSVPQNQVIVAIQPSLVSVIDTNESAGRHPNNGLKLDENLLPRWFLTYSMIIEDPVLGATMNSYSQFIPIDSETVAIAQEAKFPENFSDSHLGFAVSIDKLMASKLKSPPNESGDYDCEWLQNWSGLSEIQIIHELSISLAHLYKRKWNDCGHLESLQGK